jgi:hypothetical protein
MPATKPAHPATVDAGHALAPDHCWLMNENSGQPGDIGTAALSISGGDTPTWGAGPVTEWDGTKHIELGTGAVLSGSTKFTVVMSIKPTTWAQDAAILNKKSAWNVDSIFSWGLIDDAGFGPYLYFELGNGTDSGSNPKVHYGHFTTGQSTSVFQQWIIAYDASLGSGQRVRMWKNGVALTLSPTLKRVDTSGWAVLNNATRVVELCQGAGWTEPRGEFSGDIDYHYVIDGFNPTAQQVADIFAHPYQFVDGVKAVAFINAANTKSIAKKTGTLTYVDAARHSSTGRVPAVLAIRRVGDEDNPLTVNFSKASSVAQGSLVEGVDYRPLGTSVVIPASTSEVDLSVHPLVLAAQRAGYDHLTLTIEADAAYDLGTPVSMDVRINHAELDKYGGDARLGRVPVTRFSPNGNPCFDVRKINGRWLLITPEGNGMWTTLTYGVDALILELQTNRDAKYGGVPQSSRQFYRQAKRMGFIGQGGYSHLTTHPSTVASASFMTNDLDRVPYLHQVQVTPFGMRGAQYCALNEYGPTPAGNVVTVDSGVFANDQRNWPDVFNPVYPGVVAFHAAAAGDLFIGGNLGVANDPWCIGVRMDDGDYCYGVGNKPDPSRLSGGHNSNGFIALVCRPTRSTRDFETYINRYLDPWCYTKLKLRDDMIAKYGTIAALNSAWGSSYTTFNSSNKSVVAEKLLQFNGTQFQFGNSITNAQGDDAKTVYDKLCPLAWVPQADDLKNTIVVYLNGAQVGHDDGAGTIVEDNSSGLSGTVNYATGILVLTFASPPASGHLLTVDYTGHAWGTGTGFLDENGGGAHLGVDNARVNTHAGVDATCSADLTDFYATMCEMYFKTMSTEIRKKYPGKLVGGPATMAAGARVGALQAIAKYLDFYEVGFVPDWVGQANAMDEDHDTTQLPVFSWATLDVGDDNDMVIYPAAGITLSATSEGLNRTVTADAGVFNAINALTDGTRSIITPDGGRLRIMAKDSDTVVRGDIHDAFGSSSYSQNGWIVSPQCWSAEKADWPDGYSNLNQAQRGAKYVTVANTMIPREGVVNGDQYFIGYDWWEALPHLTNGEFHLFGFFTKKWNAYDGVEAIIASGTDLWGYTTGGESEDFGDGVTKVREGNALPGQLIKTGRGFF